MGIVASLPLLGSLAGLGSTLFTGMLASMACMCTSSAASALTKSCNCNSSVATRVGYSIIFLLSSMMAWIMKTDVAIKLIEKWSYDYIKMSCPGEEGKCYGVLAVHRILFALALFHLILSLLLINVKDTRSARASIQNGWWGPKLLSILLLTTLTFFIPNPFFIFYSTYLALPGATLFILIGLILLIDFAHSWSETCLLNWESSPTGSSLWKYVLIGSTLLLYAVTLTLTILDFVYFAGAHCGLNTTFISLNLALSLIVTVLSISPTVQECNPRSGLAQSGMVVAYTAYLVTSAIANHSDGDGQCNPLQSRSEGAKTGMVVLGAVFTFLAIAYSTSRAATQSLALVGGAGKAGGKRSREGYSALGMGSGLEDGEDTEEDGEMGFVTRTQPGRQESLRYLAIKAAVDAGSLPASALQMDDPESSDDESDYQSRKPSSTNDDERSGTKYNYAWFHVIFILAAMYVAMLLTDWNFVSGGEGDGEGGSPVLIGRSHVSMWMRVISSWVALGLYAWSLLAPVVMPDRFGDL